MGAGVRVLNEDRVDVPRRRIIHGLDWEHIRRFPRTVRPAPSRDVRVMNAHVADAVSFEPALRLRLTARQRNVKSGSSDRKAIANGSDRSVVGGHNGIRGEGTVTKRINIAEDDGYLTARVADAGNVRLWRFPIGVRPGIRVTWLPSTK